VAPDPALTRLLGLAAASTPADRTEATAAAIQARCWNVSALSRRCELIVEAGETLEAAVDRLNVDWNPQWLVDAGYSVSDTRGADLAGGATATTRGAITWTPSIRLPRVTDKPSDSASTSNVEMKSRWAGEVAILALWKRAANSVGIDESDRDLTLGPSDGGTRGARFKQAIIETLRTALPTGWDVLPEVPLAQIRGLHLRQDVGGRKSDIVVVKDQMLAGIVSSKWTWRSDRGTEAAQVLFLKRYRPDVPYVLVTNEFLRAAVVAQESVEDAAFFLCPRWIGATIAVQTVLSSGGQLRTEFPRLSHLAERADEIARAMLLHDAYDLVERLKRAYTIL
jgi:uncharacterized membrane protein